MGPAYRVVHARKDPKPLSADPREGSGPRQGLPCPGAETVPVGRHIGGGDSRARARLLGDGLQCEQGLADSPGAAPSPARQASSPTVRARPPISPVAVFFAEVGDVRASGFEDPQAEQAEHGHQREVARAR